MPRVWCSCLVHAAAPIPHFVGGETAPCADAAVRPSYHHLRLGHIVVDSMTDLERDLAQVR
eukprot:329107-Chlamydomonas_euryale.AAC.13